MCRMGSVLGRILLGLQVRGYRAICQMGNVSTSYTVLYFFFVVGCRLGRCRVLIGLVVLAALSGNSLVSPSCVTRGPSGCVLQVMYLGPLVSCFGPLLARAVFMSRFV